MANVITKGIFPSQAVSDAEKASEQYGLQVGNAIESEWFRKDGGNTRYFANRDNFHRLRLYARGEQSVEKYKNELSINGDLYFNSLLNDWAKFDINKRTKHDAAISSGLAIMACNKHLYRPNAKIEKPKLNISISKYNNTGSNSKIIR